MGMTWFVMICFSDQRSSSPVMSHKKSFADIEKNKETWTKNLVKFQQSHKRRGIAPSEETSLEEKCRIPLKTQIVGRYHVLGTQVKGRKERLAQICKEVTKLWENKLNFPHVSNQVIVTKLDKVLKTYDECVKRGKYDALNEVFDITKVNDQWLSTEDKELYHLQVESKGQVGYSTGQLASKKTIHPSKRRKVSVDSASVLFTSTVTSDDPEPVVGSGSECKDSDYEVGDEDEITPPPTRKHNKSKVATNLVTSSRVSTSKAAKICKQLSRDGIIIPTPSQAAIYKSTFREAAKLKAEMIEKLQSEQWSLHFDGKHIEANEYHVVVLKNETREVKVGALRLKDGKAHTIAEGIEKVIDEYKLWNAIKMIVADTASVNTGKKNGVVIALQRMFSQKGVSKPQFISCQHHVLDRILRVVMDDELGGKTSSPNIEYPFVCQLLNEYDELKAEFVNGTEHIVEKSGWRDDMKFFFHLTRVFRFFSEKGHFPLVHFQKIPNISNARWNSRAILAILAFILIPATRVTLEKVCRFVSYDWAQYWFTDQMYKDKDYTNLAEILKPYDKALRVLQNHWKQEPSVIKIPRSNQCAERAIKVMQDLYAACRNKDKLELRFLRSNKQ